MNWKKIFGFGLIAWALFSQNSSSDIITEDAEFEVLEEDENTLFDE